MPILRDSYFEHQTPKPSFVNGWKQNELLLPIFVQDVINKGTTCVSMAIIYWYIVKHSVALLSSTFIQYIGMGWNSQISGTMTSQ